MPYSLLDERSKKMGRESVRESVCTLLAYGYSLETLSLEKSMFPIITLSVRGPFITLPLVNHITVVHQII